MSDPIITTYGRCRFLEPWPDWDVAIHAEQPQIDRQGRSMTYPFSFRVSRKNRTARFSSTSDLPYYDTTLSSCTCHDFQNRHLPCKHIYRLAVELGIIEIIKRGPGGYDKKELDGIKASGDIDSAPEQIKRQARAGEKKCDPISVDYDFRTGVFAGSGKTPYATTEDSCTCRDFFVRRLPCKHIYRLRMELQAHNTETTGG